MGNLKILSTLLLHSLSLQAAIRILMKPIATMTSIGFWANLKTENDSICSYQRCNKPPKEASGFKFMGNDTVIERTSGWCATPPLSFFNVKSTFSTLDSTIYMFNSFDESQCYQSWRIIHLNAKELKVVKKYHPTTF